MANLDRNGYIREDGEIIGVVEWSGNVILDIHIESDHRGNGVGTEIISTLVDNMKQDGYSCVRTTTVVSSAMEIVLDRNGFDRYIPERDAMELNETVDNRSDYDGAVVWRKEL